MKIETPRARLKKAKVNLHYWQGMARADTASLRRTLQKVAEVEMVCAAIEAEIRQKQNPFSKNYDFINIEEAER